jgi:hypothetical protein
VLFPDLLAYLNSTGAIAFLFFLLAFCYELGGSGDDEDDDGYEKLKSRVFFLFTSFRGTVTF